jgi:iron complex outermembrane recepter protein
MITRFFSICLVTLAIGNRLLAQPQATAVKDTIYYLSPVLVTATQARERETPVTFSNLNRHQIQERYSVQDVPVLLAELPSVTFYSENGNGIGYNYINLRGFDQRRLSVMINGIPQNDPEDHNVYWIDFPDLMASTELIQVQRGAGSAFYGPPAIGGSVNLITNPFSQKPGITLETMFGFQEFGDSSRSLPLTTKKFSVSINSGLINQKYMLYGKLGKIQSEGYRTNSWVDLNSYFLGAVRFDKDMTTRFHFFGGPFTDGLSYFGLPKFVNENKKLRRQNLADGWTIDSTGQAYSYGVPRRPQETESFSQPHYELLHEWRLSPTMTLSNTFFYYTGDGYYDYDASWADTSMLRIGYNYGIPTSQNPTNALVRGYVGNKQWGWLPRVEIDHGAGTVTLGAEIRSHRSVHWGKIQYAGGLPQNFDPDYHFYEYNGEKDIFSIYIHEIYRPEQNLSIMGDLQLVGMLYGIKNEKYLGNNFNLPYLFLNPRIGLNYNITDYWNGYISLGYTSREPRLKNLYAAEYSYYGETPQFKATVSNGILKYDFTEPLTNPEQLLDLEIGAGFQGTASQLSADVFWMEFTNELVENGQVDIFGQPITGNAERTRHIGIEVDGFITLSDALTLSGNISLSRNKLIHHRVYVKSEDPSGNKIVIPKNLDDNPIAGFPDALGNLRLTYHTDAITVSIPAKYVGSFYTDNFKDDNNKNYAYTVFNMEVLYQLPTIMRSDFTLRGEIHNIFNKLYFTSGKGNAFFPAAERNYLIGLTANL